MKYYFLLQYKRLKRNLREAGFNPNLVAISIFILFVFLSHSFFEKIKYPQYIYPIIALGILNILGNVKRNEFIKNVFPISSYRKIRCLENLIVATPFFLFLVFKQEYISAIGIYLLGFGLSFLNKINSFGLVIPTPFHKRPFEFIAGFRKTFPLFILTYMLTFIAIKVDNFNLGIFALIVASLICMKFYTSSENLFYVWIHSSSPSLFLKNKIKVACIHSFILSFPIVISLLLFNLEKAHFVLIFEVLGLLFITTSLLGKYAYFPAKENINQSVILAFSMLFPPLFLIIIPYLYSRSKQKLAKILK
jgi:hypothetical protein